MDVNIIIEFLIANNLYIKVRSVTFDASCSAENRRAVMAILGGQLLSVKYDCCENIELVSCTELRELEIQYGNVKPTKSTRSIDAETFLPQLRKLHVDCCFGLESRLFENVRSTLVDLYIRCVHFGIPEVSKAIGTTCLVSGHNFKALSCGVLVRPSHSTRCAKSSSKCPILGISCFLTTRFRRMKSGRRTTISRIS